ncbi:MAG: HAMP domain-containing sensor histidine kinase [Bacteroidales bacterium]|jgi:two-component system phosphate regulon sensor histidine kinase PhoR|nr:HAMP domain-containing sensor histidine kinase [Bacteroidales bacterium]
MSRQKFAGLILMMLISLTGIIWVQVVWIKNAISIRNENFNNAVIAGLNDAADIIESTRRMSFFNDFMFDDPLSLNNMPGDVTGYLRIGTYSSSNGGSFSYRITNQSFAQIIDTAGGLQGTDSLLQWNDTSFYSDTGTYVISPSSAKEDLIGISGKQQAGEAPGTVYVSRQKFLEWVRRRASEFQNMSSQMISDVFEWETKLQLDPDEVDYALKRSFMFAGIETPFEFAIIRNGKVQDSHFRKSQTNDFVKSRYRVRLFPDNIIRQDLNLSVIFPERTNYVLGSMAWILGGSFLFSMIILATFALSLFFLIRQKKISEMKSDFLNNMTHEFKTPIATISLAADTITNPKVIKDESSIRHFISLIKKENNRMNKKVETILQIASLDKKEIDFSFETVSLHSVIEKAVDIVDIQVQQKNGTIKLKLDADKHEVFGDSEHLLNLVNNLLDNAIKYSLASPEITISTASHETGILMSVEDKGIGMSRSVQSRIFERFYRQSSGNIHDVKGFGLGLNYVRAIIDAHHGNIVVTSEPGKGSRFEIYLPYNLEN